jgi:hypothetical protein
MPTEHFNPIDEDTGARIEISSTHNLVHKGKVYCFHVEDLAATALTVIDVCYVTGDEEVHVDASRSAMGARVQTILYENCVQTTAGSVINYFNRNRNYPDTNGVQVYKGGTFATVGSAINTSQILADSTNQSTSVTKTSDDVEWIFKANTKYLARTTFTGPTVYTHDSTFYECQCEEE